MKRGKKTQNIILRNINFGFPYTLGDAESLEVINYLCKCHFTCLNSEKINKKDKN